MSRYGPEYWDKYGSYRTPIAFHLSILVLLRAYFIWVIAALSRRPQPCGEAAMWTGFYQL